MSTKAEVAAAPRTYRSTDMFISQRAGQVLVGLATLLCLLPFLDKAFNIDDTLFVWAARQIARDPLNPYGFELNWFRSNDLMSQVTMNPPLASYYGALAGSFAGWSEWRLHAAFLVPALVAILATYRLAQRFTRSPLVAAAATLFTPGFLVSASSVMCDTMMVAIWLLATIFWIDGLEKRKLWRLLVSALLIAVCSLTKYFGACLIPLLLVYSLMSRWGKVEVHFGKDRVITARRRELRSWKLRSWVWYLLIPVLILVAYQNWTRMLYGQGLLRGAIRFARISRHAVGGSTFTKGILDLSFLGGCTIGGLTFAPLIWSRKQILISVVAGAMAALPVAVGWLSLGPTLAPRDFSQRFASVGVQLAFCIASGISILALAIRDFWRHRDTNSFFLMLWVVGTFIFTGFLNWVINARSILPAIPAAGILLARRLDEMRTGSPRRPLLRSAVPLAVAAALSLWVTWGDADLANSARKAATLIAEKTRNQASTVWFEGHWGFQYYMESMGALPFDVDSPEAHPGDFIAMSENNLLLFEVRPEFVASKDTIEIAMSDRVTTTHGKAGAGFYSAEWGPLPFVIGPVPPERYSLVRLRADKNTR
jgi:hypothetical protein